MNNGVDLWLQRSTNCAEKKVPCAGRSDLYIELIFKLTVNARCPTYNSLVKKYVHSRHYIVIIFFI